MKNIIYIFILCFFMLGFTFNPALLKVEEDVIAMEVKIQKGDYKYVFSTGEDVDITLRIFGINPMEEAYGGQEIFQYAVLSYMFIASPAEISNKIYNKSLCEKTAADHASLLQVIVNDSQVDDVVKNLSKKQTTEERICAQVQGTSLALKEYRHNDGEPEYRWEFAGDVAPLSFNPKKFLLLKSIEPVACESLEPVACE